MGPGPLSITYGPEDIAFGLVNVTEAAGLGSELGAYTLGEAFFKGLHNQPKDSVQARFWLKKAVDKKCDKHLTREAIADAEKWLRELNE